MKKGFSILFTTILISAFIASKNIKTNVGLCDNYDVVKSPSLKRNFERYFLNDGSIAMTHCPIGETAHCYLKFEDNKVYCSFKDLPQPKKLEYIKKRCFAVLIDGIKGPIDYKFLEKQDGVNGECSFTIPINSDCLEVHVYGQDDNDPDFLLREENFLCKSKFFSSYATLAYIKKIENCVKYYDRKGNLIPLSNVYVYQSGIPNIYVIDIAPISRLWDIEPEFAMGFLDLPDGKNDLVKFEDRMFPVSFLGVKLPGDSAGDSMLPHYKYYLYVKVPQGVTKFSVKMYDQHIIPCYSEDITSQEEDSTHIICYLGELKVDLNGE